MTNKNKTDSWFRQNLPGIAVVAFALIISTTLIYINSTSNILGHSYRDAYLYLIQSFKLSGFDIVGYDYVDHLSPLIPFLTALLFKLGFISETSLFTASGIFYPIGIIGVYCLLKLRFNRTISSFGAILYGSLSINLMWAANGTLDIPSIALSIWSFYFFILAMEKNQKYFYIAIPLAILSFLAKYTGALIFAVIIAYFLSKRDIFGNIKRYFKHGLGGAIASIIIMVPYLLYMFSNNIPLGFLSQAEEISERTTTSAVAVAKHTTNQLFYYFQNMPRFIYNPQWILSYAILIIGAIGLIYGIYKFAAYLKDYYNKSDEKIGISFLENKKWLSFLNNLKLKKEIVFIILIISIIGMASAFLTASKVSFIISEMLFFASAFLFSICFNSIFKDLSRLNIFTNRNKEDDGKSSNKYNTSIMILQ